LPAGVDLAFVLVAYCQALGRRLLRPGKTADRGGEQDRVTTATLVALRFPYIVGERANALAKAGLEDARCRRIGEI
jgi:hypothetical protein